MREIKWRERLVDPTFWIAIVLIVLALLDLSIAGWVYSKTSLLVSHVVLIGIAVLLLLHRQISKLKIAADGFEYEALASEVRSAAAEMTAAGAPHQQLSIPGPGRSATAAPGWGLLAMYRIMLRMLLLRLVQASAAVHAEAQSVLPRIPPMAWMIETCQRHEILAPPLAAELERLRAATVFVEWGPPAPPVREIEFALAKGAELLEQLEAVVLSREAARGPLSPASDPPT